MNCLIKSIALLDLETTNLPEYDGFTTKITELSFIACSVEHLCSLKSSETMPRILHKLSLCLNPRKLINDLVSKKTGLDNFMLERENPFTEHTGNIIKLFLGHLEQPVCLIAHYGNKLDFPVLIKELKSQKVVLQENLYCLDSAQAFINMDSRDELHPSPTGCKSRNSNQFKPGYALSKMYKRFCNKEPEIAHRAEADALMLLECIVATKNDFIPFMNKELLLFSNFIPTGTISQ